MPKVDSCINMQRCIKFILKDPYSFPFFAGYLTILQPVFAEVLWYGALSGCLGLSMQLSLMSDLLSMLTLHIYCFYAYAAR
jgi:phosphatidylinositol glycan class Q protein